MNETFNNLYIFEMANNHQGQVEHGVRIIREMGKIARKYGIRAGVKFQFRDLDSFIHPDFKDRNDVKHIPRFVSTRLSVDEFQEMTDAVLEEQMIPIATPFDEASVSTCIKLGIQIIKIASCSATDWPLLERAAASGKSMIVSTGGIDMFEIDNVVSFLTHKRVEFALMHCVGIYPTDNKFLNLEFITRLKSRYANVPIGYSGHEAPDNISPGMIAASKGASMFERHVGYPTDEIQLNAYSMNPEQVDRWVESIAVSQEISGSPVKTITQPELDSMLSLQRGVFARRHLKKGEVIKADDVYFAMPCAEGQLNSGQFGRYRVEYTASRDYEPNAAVTEESAQNKFSNFRRVIHDIKGLIQEARVPISKDYDIEISHHYGMEKFRETGALIISVVNREYCKKLIVMLASQNHPNHHHKKKEETFHLIWGDLNVVLNGRTIQMEPGDKLLIERGAWHQFSTKTGAIIEEISTTHSRGDSYYEDENIRKLDPMQRKTIIDEW